MFCSKCGSPNNDGAAFCAKCGAALGTAGAGNAGAATSSPETTTMRGHAAAAPRTAAGKNPTVALVLSIFLGAFGGGQFYNGDWKKGLAMAAATLVLGVATGGLVAFGIWIWSMVDAYQVASGKWSIW
jgi:TM2 domain-containing membrane protein YozV